MSAGAGGDPGAEAVAAALRAAEPSGERPLAGLLGRLAATGRLRAVDEPGGRPAADVAIRGIAYDSRRVVTGGLFVAVPGAHVDGHDYVRAALAAGASAIVAERATAGTGVPQLIVDRSQHALATVAAWWYGDPGLRLGVVGITGTDGKTTTAGMAVAALEAAGVRAGLVSTAEQKIGAARAVTPTHVTTPEAPEVQRALAAMSRAGDAAAVLETTSHGLFLERVGEVPYDVAVFTNLSHEHLELHGSFEAYRDAKRTLFERLGGAPGRPPKPRSLPGDRPWPRGGIVNLDDPNAGAFTSATRGAGATLVTYGLAATADVRASRIRETRAGLRADVVTPRGTRMLELALVGRFNVHNALAVIALGDLLGLNPVAIDAALAGFRGIPGRMQRVDRGQPFAVVVDYAHTPASLATALDALAPLVTGNGGLIAVFGSAGERDVAKRAIMGRVAGERCRLVVAADEDPRGEDRSVILDQIASGAEKAGLRRGKDLLLVPDREEAIRAAFARTRPGDVVLLAGKGHERTILYADREIPWDEASVAERLLGELGYDPGGGRGFRP